MPTLTSLLPFGPVPPLQPDLARLLSPDPYGAADTATVDRLDMLTNVVGMFEDTCGWLGAQLRQPEARATMHCGWATTSRQPASAAKARTGPCPCMW